MPNILIAAKEESSSVLRKRTQSHVRTDRRSRRTPLGWLSAIQQLDDRIQRRRIKRILVKIAPRVLEEKAGSSLRAREEDWDDRIRSGVWCRGDLPVQREVHLAFLPFA